MRTVSGPSAAEIVKTITQPGYFVELQFIGGTTRLSTFGTTTWNAQTWTGANVQIGGMDADGKRAQVLLWDPDATFRTLALSNGGTSLPAGIRNRIVKIWQAQFPALGAGDPNMIFYGVGDEVRIARGYVQITCARLNSGVLLTPRMRISPANGFNFLAAPGTTIAWGDVVITLQPGQR